MEHFITNTFQNLSNPLNNFGLFADILPGIKHEPFISNWEVVYFILILSLFAWLMLSSGNHMLSLFQSAFNSQTANRLYGEKADNILHPSFRYDMLFYSTTGVMLYHFQQIYYTSTLYSGWIMVFINIGAVLLFFNLKFFLYILSGAIFDVGNQVDEYLFYLKSMNRVSGFFMLPLSIILFFTDGFITNSLLILGAVILFSLSILGIYRGMKIKGEKDFSIYYLILYLCTLEILPVLILWRTFR